MPSYGSPPGLTEDPFRTLSTQSDPSSNDAPYPPTNTTTPFSDTSQATEKESAEVEREAEAEAGKFQTIFRRLESWDKSVRTHLGSVKYKSIGFGTSPTSGLAVRAPIPNRSALESQAVEVEMDDLTCVWLQVLLCVQGTDNHTGSLSA